MCIYIYIYLMDVQLLGIYIYVYMYIYICTRDMVSEIYVYNDIDIYI